MGKITVTFDPPAEVKNWYDDNGVDTGAKTLTTITFDIEDAESEGMLYDLVEMFGEPDLIA